MRSAGGTVADVTDAIHAHLTLILVAVILLLASLCSLRRQTRSAWILNSSFHVLTATSMNKAVQSNAIIFLLAFLVTAMATTIDTPDTDESCAYCGLPIFEHDPICVRDCTADCDAPSYFCNFACLSAYIDERNLALGDACEWSPE